MMRISSHDSASMLCRLVDVDDLYQAVQSDNIGMRQAHLLLATLGGFVIEYQGERIKLAPGQTLEMTSMAAYSAVSAKLDARTPEMVTWMQQANTTAADYASQNHPDGETFTPEPVSPQGARLMVFARKPKRI